MAQDTETQAKPKPLNILIVGAGIGGLTAAIGFRLDGHNVIVLEQASAFGEVMTITPLISDINMIAS